MTKQFGPETRAKIEEADVGAWLARHQQRFHEEFHSSVRMGYAEPMEVCTEGFCGEINPLRIALTAAEEGRRTAEARFRKLKQMYLMLVSEHCSDCEMGLPCSHEAALDAVLITQKPPQGQETR